MTHAATAHSIKGRGAGAPHQDAPCIGTHTRALYDLLFANAGRWFTPSSWTGSGPNNGRTLDHLRDTYGLDVRCRKLGVPGRPHGGTRSQWLLAGEWHGRVYLDYVADPGLARREPQP